jgi:cyclic lactone autoinducer peptide
MMKNVIQKASCILASLAIVAASLNVNSTCAHLIYQPKVPEEANKLKKGW